MIKYILEAETARKRVQSVVDHEMVRAYLEIGREIVEDEQQGEQRAEYDKALIQSFASELTLRHGKGFTANNLLAMRRFFLNFQIQHALRAELSWTHYRQLLKIEEPKLYPLLGSLFSCYWHQRTDTWLTA